MAITRISNVEDTFLSSYTPDEQRQILTYLLSPDFTKVTGGPSEYVDQTTHRQTRTGTFFSKDDSFSWSDTDFFLIRDNITRIPHDFAEHVFEFYRRGGKLSHTVDFNAFGRVERIRLPNNSKAENE